MIQHSSLPPAISTIPPSLLARKTPVTESQPSMLATMPQAGVADNRAIGSRLNTISRKLWLPDSRATFGLYLVGLGLIVAGMSIHTLLSSQIMQSEIELAQLRSRYAKIEQASAELIWQIAEARRLDDVRARAAALGYQAAPRPTYLLHMAQAPAPDPVANSTGDGSRPETTAVGTPLATTSGQTVGARVASLFSYLRRQPAPAAATTGPTPPKQESGWLTWWRETRARGTDTWSGFTQEWRFDFLMPKQAVR